MPRFYLPNLPDAGELNLPDSIVRHIQVLRLNVGDDLILFDGRGKRVHATLTELGKRKAACTLAPTEQINSESALSIHLLQAISSGERMDFTIQKKRGIGRGEHYADLERALRG